MAAGGFPRKVGICSKVGPRRGAYVLFQATRTSGRGHHRARPSKLGCFKSPGRKFEKTGHVVDRLGWDKSLYVRPGATLPKEIDHALVIDAREAVEGDWGAKGSFDGWRAGVNRFADG